jgi:uncharacterized protein YkwD
MMKIFVGLLLLNSTLNLFAQQSKNNASPLAIYSTEWNGKQYALCNTATGVSYMSNQEKEIIYIINLVRRYPSLFCKTVLNSYPLKTGKQHLLQNKYYYQSLVNELNVLNQLSLLMPDSICYVSAFCHAITSGKSGYVGHERQSNSCKENQYYSGECCAYGYSNPLDIVMQLLIDEDVPSLGHRRILLNNYQTIGVSMQPHTQYFFNTVLDLEKID